MLAAFANRANAQTFTFSNATTITLPGLDTATPAYPSLLSVSGVPASVGEITVTLRGLAHPFINDLNFVLQAPTGGTVALMVGAGSPDAGTEANNTTLVFRDMAATEIPTDAELFSGTYRPTNGDPNFSLPTPAPPAPYGSTLASVSSSDPNGQWKLFASNAGIDAGTLANGWSIGFAPVVIPEAGSGTLLGAAATVGMGTLALRRRRRFSL